MSGPASLGNQLPQGVQDFYATNPVTSVVLVIILMLTVLLYMGYFKSLNMKIWRTWAGAKDDYDYVTGRHMLEHADSINQRFVDLQFALLAQKDKATQLTDKAPLVNQLANMGLQRYYKKYLSQAGYAATDAAAAPPPPAAQVAQ